MAEKGGKLRKLRIGVSQRLRTETHTYLDFELNAHMDFSYCDLTRCHFASIGGDEELQGFVMRYGGEVLAKGEVVEEGRLSFLSGGSWVFLPDRGLSLRLVFPNHRKEPGHVVLFYSYVPRTEPGHGVFFNTSNGANYKWRVTKEFGAWPMDMHVPGSGWPVLRPHGANFKEMLPGDVLPCAQKEETAAVEAAAAAPVSNPM